MKYNLRKVEEKDVQLLFNWVNDPDARFNAVNPKRITWEEHVTWFNSKLNDPSTHMYILGDINENLGIIRFDKKLENFMISLSVDKNHRGKGLGNILLKEGIKNLNKIVSNIHLLAYIKKGNIGSEKIFFKNEFTLSGEELINGVKFNVYEKKNA